MVKIDKVYYINIDYRVDKRIAQEVACALVDVPYDRLERFPARMGNDKLPPTLEELARMMVDDGWEEWGCYTQPEYSTHRSWLASVWSKLSLLRQLIERQETAILMSDTHYLWRLDFSTFEAELGSLPDMKVLFLSHFCREEDPVCMAQYNRMKPTAVEGVYSDFYGYGDFCAVFTPLGAKHYLEMWKTLPRYQSAFVNYTFGLEHDMDGYYACEPCLARSIPFDSSYPIMQSDKSDWGPQYSLKGV